jgi:MFS family permease
VALLTIAGSFRPVREGPPVRMHREIAEGLRYLLGHPLLRVLALMVGISNMASAAVFSVFVLYAVSPGPLGLDAAGFGLLATALALGSVVGSFLVERFERRLGRANLLAIAMGVNALVLVAPALTTFVPLIAVAWIIGGVVGIGWNVVTVSLRQRIVPDRLLGRVNASYRLLAWGTMPLGAALGGLAGELFGVRAVFVIFGGLSALLLLGRLVVTDRAIEAAELPLGLPGGQIGDDAPTEAPPDQAMSGEAGADQTAAGDAAGS